MATFTGRLTLIDNKTKSILATSTTDYLLLKAEVPDEAQAAAAATFYLIQTQHLHDGQKIDVVGSANNPGGGQPKIRMKSASASASPFRAAATKGAKKAATKGGKKKATKGAKKKATTKAGAKGSTRKSSKKRARK